MQYYQLYHTIIRERGYNAALVYATLIAFRKHRSLVSFKVKIKDISKYTGLSNTAIRENFINLGDYIDIESNNDTYNDSSIVTVLDNPILENSIIFNVDKELSAILGIKASTIYTHLKNKLDYHNDLYQSKNSNISKFLCMSLNTFKNQRQKLIEAELISIEYKGLRHLTYYKIE